MVLNIISTRSLASSLGQPATDIAADARAQLIIELTNGLITDRWRTPVTPVPTAVTTLALEVAGRAYASTPGVGPRESVTKTADGVSKTERYAVPTAVKAGVTLPYLTDDEVTRLNQPGARRRRRTIRTALGY